MARYDLQRALQMLENDEADEVMFWDLKRFSRDVAYFNIIKKRINQAGKRLIYATHEFSDDPTGNLHQSVLVSYAQYEREQTNIGSALGRETSAKLGKQPVRSQAPFGLVLVTKAHVQVGMYPTHLEGKYLIIPENQTKVDAVVQAFEMFASGVYSRPGIGRWLGERFLPPRHETMGSKEWHSNSVKVLMQNPIWIGKAYHRKMVTLTDEDRIFRTSHDRKTGEDRPMSPVYFRANPDVPIPIPDPLWREIREPDGTIRYELAEMLIAPSIWKRVQDILDNTAEEFRGANARRFWISGLIQCPHCKGAARVQHSLNHKNGKDFSYHYIVCKKCGKNLARVDKVEAAVIDHLTALMSSTKLVEAALADWERHKWGGDEQAKMRAMLLGELQELAEEEAANARLQVRAEMARDKRQAGPDPAIYDKVLAGIEEQRAELHKRLERLHTTPPTTLPVATDQVERLRCLAQVTRDMLLAEEIDATRKHEAVRKIIKIVIPRVPHQRPLVDGELVEITWNLCQIAQFVAAKCITRTVDFCAMDQS